MNYEPIFVHCPRTGHTFLDVGANKGQWFPLWNGYKRVMAFEPSPDLSDSLRQLAPYNVEVLPYALWSENTELEFRRYGSPERTSAVTTYPDLPELKVSETFVVSALALDNLGLTDVDFVKLNVEGAAGHVLEGGIQTMARCRPILNISLHRTDLAEEEVVTEILEKLSYSWKRIFSKGSSYWWSAWPG